MCDSTQAAVGESTYKRGGSCPECGGETYPEPMLCHGGPDEETSGYACVECSWSVFRSDLEAVKAVTELRVAVVLEDVPAAPFRIHSMVLEPRTVVGMPVEEVVCEGCGQYGYAVPPETCEVPDVAWEYRCEECQEGSLYVVELTSSTAAAVRAWTPGQAVFRAEQMVSVQETPRSVEELPVAEVDWLG